MERRVIGWNPDHAYARAIEITRSDRVLFCSGHISSEGTALKVLHPGDMRSQILKAIDNLEATLTESGYELADVVRLTV